MQKNQKILQWFNQPIAIPVAVGGGGVSGGGVSGGGVSGGVEQVSRMPPPIECHTFLYKSNLSNPE